MFDINLDIDFVSCATCQFWSGQTKYSYPRNIQTITNTQGTCSNTYFGAYTSALASCKNWVPRYTN